MIFLKVPHPLKTIYRLHKRREQNKRADELSGRKIRDQGSTKKALAEKRNALRIAIGNSCSTQSEISYKIKKKAKTLSKHLSAIKNTNVQRANIFLLCNLDSRQPVL